MVPDRTDFMDAEAFLAGDVTPALVAATLRARGYEMRQVNHPEGHATFEVRSESDDDWTSLAVHRAQGPRGDETLVVTDRFMDGPEILGALTSQFGGRWRESCDKGVPFVEAKATHALEFAPSDMLADRLTRLLGPLGAGLVADAIERRPEAAEEIADAIREHGAAPSPRM